MPVLIPKPIEEFCLAAGRPFSYNLRDNLYIWFGILWGLPIPAVTILLQIHFMKETGSPHHLLAVAATPAQWFFLAHPVLFGLIFGVLGTIRSEKDAQVRKMIEQLQELSSIDPLTGLRNRRYFVDNYPAECARSLRRNESLSLLFLDIDNFKRINDKHGHRLGDDVLRTIGAYLRSQCRPYDTPVRWGGEEFLILLRATHETAAFTFAERIRAGIEAGIDSAIPFHFTVSIGLTQYRQADTLDQITERADQALYHAKQAGKNRVSSFSALQAVQKP